MREETERACVCGGAEAAWIPGSGRSGTVGSSARARLVVFEHEWNGRKAEGTRTRAVPHGGEEEPLEPYYQER